MHQSQRKITSELAGRCFDSDNVVIFMYSGPSVSNRAFQSSFFFIPPFSAPLNSAPLSHKQHLGGGNAGATSRCYCAVGGLWRKAGT